MLVSAQCGVNLPDKETLASAVQHVYSPLCVSAVAAMVCQQ